MFIVDWFLLLKKIQKITQKHKAQTFLVYVFFIFRQLNFSTIEPVAPTYDSQKLAIPTAESSASSTLNGF